MFFWYILIEEGVALEDKISIIGNKFGDKYQNKAELVGGIILVLLGIKILLEHLNIIKF